ncbi:MAG: hypothetical protein ACRECQ_06380 [Burkholderiaceae bacterium]
MDGTIVYSKTPIGIAEISLRSAQLSMTTRRVLIMIDGKRTVDDLSILVKPGEIEGVIESLESGGLIQRVSPHQGPLDVPTLNGREAEAALPPTISGPTTGGKPEERDASPITLEEVKRRAVRGLNDRLGPEAEALAIRLEKCRTVEDFRNHVREAERFISMVLGPAAAQDYLKYLRRRS